MANLKVSIVVRTPPLPLRPHPGFKCRAEKHEFLLSNFGAAIHLREADFLSKEWGAPHYALLFEPRTYGSSTNPLIFQVGYYRAVAGLGQSPGDVTINGEINVSNQCFGSGSSTSCTALVNF
jgi:hypothetical protein